MIKTIFNWLLTNEQYFAVVYPFLTKEILEEKEYRVLYDQIKKYTDRYAKRPDFNDVRLMIDNDSNLDEDTTARVVKTLNLIKKVSVTKNLEFILDETEEWVRLESLKSAIIDSVDIIENQNSKQQIQIYDKIKEAISIDFKNSLGKEFLLDYESQYDYYISDEEKFISNVSTLNEAWCGGLPRKTITSFIGRTNIGKTLVLCHTAADFIRKGYNVCYISGEMGEDALYQRIDANIFSMNMIDLGKKLSKTSYAEKVERILNDKQYGRLFIKEYPTGVANKLNIQTYLRELKLKKHSFVPDIIIIDYLNIFSSCRLPPSQGSDSYRYIKSITEEFRALAVEENVAVVTATQTNRSGSEHNAKDSSMSDTSDSYGTPMTVDCMISIIQDEDLAEQGKYILKILKTRFGGNVNELYTIGVEKSKMLLYDLPDDEKIIPVNVKDKLDAIDKMKGKKPKFDSEGDEMGFIFEDELE